MTNLRTFLIIVTLQTLTLGVRAQESNLPSQINVKRFGAAGDSTTDDTKAIQKSLDIASRAARTVTLPAGGYVITKPLIIPRNVQLIGDGLGFTSALIPVDCDAIWIKGSTQEGGFAFRNKIQNLNINMRRSTSGAALVIENAYNVTLSDLFIYEAPDVGISITNSNHVAGDNVIVYGRGSDEGTGIKISDAVVNLYNIDIENIRTALKIGPDKDPTKHVSVFGGFIERFGESGIHLNDSQHNSFVGVNIVADSPEKMPVLVEGMKGSKSKTNTFMGGYLGFAGEIKSNKNFKVQGVGQTINVGGD